MDRLTGFSGIEPTTFNEMLAKVPERTSSTQIHPMVAKLAEELELNNELNKLTSAFPSALNMKIKQQFGLTADVECCSKAEFVEFLTSQ